MGLVYLPSWARTFFGSQWRHCNRVMIMLIQTEWFKLLQHFYQPATEWIQKEMIACTQTSLLKKVNESYLPRTGRQHQDPATFYSERLSTNYTSEGLERRLFKCITPLQTWLPYHLQGGLSHPSFCKLFHACVHNRIFFFFVQEWNWREGNTFSRNSCVIWHQLQNFSCKIHAAECLVT